jgi:hypothetical protein
LSIEQMGSSFVLKRERIPISREVP